MPRLSPFGHSFCAFLLLLSSVNTVVNAQQSVDDCARHIAVEYDGLYDNIRENSSNGAMKWCPWWAAVCGYVYNNCKPAVSCDFTNYDPRITTQYDPNSSVSTIYYFQNCSSCNVQTAFNSQNLPVGVEVPAQIPLPSPKDMLAPGESPNDMNAQRAWVSKTSSSVTIAFVVGGFIGTLIAARASRDASAAQNAAYAAGAGVAAVPIVASNALSGFASNIKDVVLNSTPFIDAVTLLMQFQYISLTGLLSLSYPALYRFFSFNFAWANLVIPTEELKTAAERLANKTQCARGIGALLSGSDNYLNMTGMTGANLDYGLGRDALGGIVYITAIIAFGLGLIIFVVTSVVLRVVNVCVKSKKIDDQIQMWPAQVCNIALRLMNWILAAVATFAFYQFVEPCSSRDLVAFGAIEFVIIMFTLITVTILIVRTARREGPEVLYPSADGESDESKYSRKWGSLYKNLKPARYWYFILEYIFVLTRSIIIGAGQRSGISQVGALIALEMITLISLSVIRPYQTFVGNTFQIFSAVRRVFSTCALIVFWQGFNILTETKRIVGMVVMIVESAYSAALFVFLVLNFGAAIVKWFTQRKLQKQGVRVDGQLYEPVDQKEK